MSVTNMSPDTSVLAFSLLWPKPWCFPHLMFYKRWNSISQSLSKSYGWQSHLISSTLCSSLHQLSLTHVTVILRIVQLHLSETSNNSKIFLSLTEPFKYLISFPVQYTTENLGRTMNEDECNMLMRGAHSLVCFLQSHHWLG